MAILKKFIGADQVDGSKILVLNNEAVRAKNQAGSAVDLFKLTTGNVLEFAKLPRAASGLSVDDVLDLTTKGYVDTAVSAVSGSSVSGLSALEARVSGIEADYGAANGLATLDGNGKIPASQLTVSAFEYKGTWNASTNTPSLANGTGNTGDVYHVTTGGTRDFGAGNISFTIGDKVVYDGAVWEKWDLTDQVTSVNGMEGAVTLVASDIETSVSGVTIQDDLDAMLKLDGTRAMTGTLDMGAYDIINVGPGISTDEPSLTVGLSSGDAQIEIAPSGQSAIDLKTSASEYLRFGNDGGQFQTIDAAIASAGYVDLKLIGSTEIRMAATVVSFEGYIDMMNHSISNLTDAVMPSDAVTMQQVLLLNGSQAMSGNLDLGGNSISGVDDLLVSGFIEAPAVSGLSALTGSEADSFAAPKGYVDAEIDAAVSGIEASLDGLAVEQLTHQSFTLSAGNVSAGYIDTTDVIVGQPMVMIGRVVLLPTEDFTVGNDGAAARKRITWVGSVAAAGAEALAENDIVHVYYHKSVNPFV